jgi:hypothetical protein
VHEVGLCDRTSHLLNLIKLQMPFIGLELQTGQSFVSCGLCFSSTVFRLLDVFS